MALTKNFKETVIQRVQDDSTFAQALLNEAATSQAHRQDDFLALAPASAGLDQGRGQCTGPALPVTDQGMVAGKVA